MKCTFYLSHPTQIFQLIEDDFYNRFILLRMSTNYSLYFNKELLCFIKIHIIIIYNYYSAGNSPYTKTKAHSTNNSPFIKSGRNKSKKQEWEDRIPKLSNFCMTLCPSPLICHVFAKIQSYSKPKNTIFLAFFLYYY